MFAVAYIVGLVAPLEQSSSSSPRDREMINGNEAEKKEKKKKKYVRSTQTNKLTLVTTHKESFIYDVFRVSYLQYMLHVTFTYKRTGRGRESSYSNLLTYLIYESSQKEARVDDSLYMSVCMGKKSA